MKIEPFCVCLILKTLRFGSVLPQFAQDPYLCVELWVNTCDNEWSSVFVARGRHGGLTSRWKRR